MKKLLSITIAILMVLSVLPLAPVALAAEKGDIDDSGRIESSDARLVGRCAIGLEDFSDDDMQIADVDEDGEVTFEDARMILRRAVRLEDSFGPEEPVDYSDGAHAAFRVLGYENGKASVVFSLVDCVGLTSGMLNFSYPDGSVTKITKALGTDARNIGGSNNSFVSEFNTYDNPSRYGFYFKYDLWDSATWEEDMDTSGAVMGEYFDANEFTFTGEEGTVVEVTGELFFGSARVYVQDSFVLANPRQSHLSYQITPSGNGPCEVRIRLTDCVGLTSGSLEFIYGENIESIDMDYGEDAYRIGNCSNYFLSDFNYNIGSSMLGFFFYEELWDSETWAAAPGTDPNDPVCGENFEAAVLTFWGADGTCNGEQCAINVTLRFSDGTEVAFTDEIVLGDDVAEEIEPTLFFNSGAYTDTGAEVVLDLVNCVGLTSGQLEFHYDESVTDITSEPGSDVLNIGAIANPFVSDLYRSDDTSAAYSFFFLEELWDSDTWAAAPGADPYSPVEGEWFQAERFFFTAPRGTLVTVTGFLIIGGVEYAVENAFIVGGDPSLLFYTKPTGNDGEMDVYLFLDNCVGLTVGDITLTFDEDVTGLTSVPGEDAAKTDEENPFFSMMRNDVENGEAEYGFYFLENLWSSEQWGDKGIRGDFFNAEIFTFTASPGAEVEVTGYIKVDEVWYNIDQTFTLGDVPQVEFLADDANNVEYNGTADVTVRLLNCVGATWGNLSFTYGDQVTDVSFQDGTDTFNANCDRELVTVSSAANDGSAQLGFFFLDHLLSDEEWEEMDTYEEYPVHGTTFDLASLTFSAREDTFVRVTGTIGFLDGSSIDVNEIFSLNNGQYFAKNDIADAFIILDADSFACDGEDHYPTVTVADETGLVLQEGVDYRLRYPSSCSEPGEYAVKVTGIGMYAGSVKTYYHVVEPLTVANVSRYPVSFFYNGWQQYPYVEVVNAAGEYLWEGYDYEVIYDENSVDPGSYFVTVVGINGYSGTVKKKYTIKTQELTTDLVTRDPVTFCYNGKAQYPTPTVYNSDGWELTEGIDYTVSYSAGSKEIGTYYMTVTGKGGCTGTVRKAYRIVEGEKLTSENVTRDPVSFPYNGEEQYPTPTVKNAAGKVLREGTDYTVSYSDASVEVGTYYVIVTGRGGYKGTVKKAYTIKEREALAVENVTRTPVSLPYNGQEQYPTVTVKNAAGKTLTEDTDYTVSYSAASIDPGSYFVIVTGIGFYEGTVRKAYTIKEREALATENVTRDPISFPYNGKEQYPTPTVKNAAGKVLTEGTDYTVSYSAASKDPGSYFVIVTGIGFYKGTVRKAYTIKEREALDTANVTRTPTSFTYNGQEQHPTVTVKNAAGKTLTEGTDYTISYSAVSKDPGSYFVIVTGTGFYKGTVKKAYVIK